MAYMKEDDPRAFSVHTTGGFTTPGSWSVLPPSAADAQAMAMALGAINSALGKPPLVSGKSTQDIIGGIYQRLFNAQRERLAKNPNREFALIGAEKVKGTLGLTLPKSYRDPIEDYSDFVQKVFGYKGVERISPLSGIESGGNVLGVPDKYLNDPLGYAKMLLEGFLRGKLVRGKSGGIFRPNLSDEETAALLSRWMTAPSVEAQFRRMFGDEKINAMLAWMNRQLGR